MSFGWLWWFVLALAAALACWRWRPQRRRRREVTEAAEDALKALYHLGRGGQPVRWHALRRDGDFPRRQMTGIVAELLRRGWAQAERRTLRLTAAGSQRAIELIRAHRLWERFLAEKEGYRLDAVHEEATRREHATSPAQAQQLSADLGHPRVDPHGDPIPAVGEEVPDHHGVPLTDWPVGTPGRISHLEDEPPRLLRRLAAAGLSPGARVTVAERTEGQVMVWSGRRRVAIDRAAAAQAFIVADLTERVPLSELEIGYSARVGALAESATQAQVWAAQGLQPGALVTVVRAEPLSDTVLYRVADRDLELPKLEANQILVDTASIEDLRLPREPWLGEQAERVRALFQRYGSWTVIRRGLLLLGPAFMVSVGYMDPGNWGTDIEGGARFGYRLLWVILLANLMAILLQVLSAKLGIATGKSLPEVCRDRYPRWLSVSLWVTAELAAIATDLAEFLGGSVALNLLFGVPLFPAALITGVIISLILLLERYGFRKVEMLIIGMIAVIGMVYMAEIWLSKPAWGAISRGLLVPSIPHGALLVIVGIIGATVMPHNLYLHSALMQSRVRAGDSDRRKREVFRFEILDSLVALNGAFLVNAAILIMSAAVFADGRLHDYSLESAHQTLTPLLGAFAGTAFAVALLASGLASSTTATMAGQVIMEGFIHHRMNVWIRRGVTMVPSLIVIGMGIDPLRILVLSQVSLSFQLPFAVVPLLLFTSDRAVMGDFVNRTLTQWLAWGAALIIMALNALLVVEILRG